jgi:hypothetical protein
MLNNFQIMLLGPAILLKLLLPNNQSRKLKAQRLLLQNKPSLIQPIISLSKIFVYPRMPAVSPTMKEGKILQWNIKIGDSFEVGDSLFSIETDKAVVDY